MKPKRERKKYCQYACDLKIERDDWGGEGEMTMSRCRVEVAIAFMYLHYIFVL